MARRLEIVVANGMLKGRRFAIPDAGLRLGRSSSNDIHLPDEKLSRNHCLFEADGESGVRIVDLSSANGTYVNGHPLGAEGVPLAVGDMVEAGDTVLRIVGEAADDERIDLGLGGGSGETPAIGSAKAEKPRARIVNLLWAVAIALIVLAIWGLLAIPSQSDRPAEVAAVETEPELREVFYEKVSADSDGIFRYELSFSPEGVLKVEVDDVPNDNRHLSKSQRLDERARTELGEILKFGAVNALEGESIGVEPDPPALESWSLRVAYATCERRVRIVNAPEPKEFRLLREKLETFSKNQLGIWAIQYSREKLIALAKEAIVLGRSKWEDRAAQYGNLHGSVVAYREAIFYLDTVNPKPDCIAEARQGLERSQRELDQLYREHRFRADRALNLGQWDEAMQELRVLAEIVPDRNDDRHREAAAKILDVERRLKGGK